MNFKANIDGHQIEIPGVKNMFVWIIERIRNGHKNFKVVDENNKTVAIVEHGKPIYPSGLIRHVEVYKNEY